jgi:ribosomal protein S3
MVEMIAYNLPRITNQKVYPCSFIKASVSKVIIERTCLLITTARPGIIIGKGGQEVDKLKKNRRLLKEVQINIFEIKDLNLTRI